MPEERPHTWLPTSRAGIAYFCVAQLAALAAVVFSAATQPIVLGDVGRAALLTAVALVHAEIARSTEQTGRRTHAAAYVDLNSTWTVAAALVLPLPLTAALITIIYAHVWLRVYRSPLYSRIFNIAMYILAASAATLIADLAGPATVTGRLSSPAGALLVIAAICAYTVVNIVVLLGWLALSSSIESPFRTAFGNAADNALEGATLCLGVFVAIALGDYPVLVPISLPLILVLHRNVLIRQLEQDARMDTKTKLLNMTAWTDAALAEVMRAQRLGQTTGVLLLDLDWFKRVNDTYGHLAGDEVLKQLAVTLRAEVRATDSVGRFGGEEFVVLLPDTSIDQIVGIAQRIRHRVEKLTVAAHNDSGQVIIEGLSVSAGAAAFPFHGHDLDELLAAADKALYEAKSNGRNQVRFAPFNSV
ncbi:MAG: diguanylate cyclase [Kibdelosporangium sp.]